MANNIPIYNYDMVALETEKQRVLKEQQAIQEQRVLDEASDSIGSAFYTGIQSSHRYTLIYSLMKDWAISRATYGETLSPETIKKEYNRTVDREYTRGQVIMMDWFDEQDRIQGKEADLAWDPNEPIESLAFAAGMGIGFVGDPLLFLGGATLNWLGKSFGVFSKTRAARNTARLGQRVLQTRALQGATKVVAPLKANQSLTSAAQLIGKAYDKTLKKAICERFYSRRNC